MEAAEKMKFAPPEPEESPGEGSGLAQVDQDQICVIDGFRIEKNSPNSTEDSKEQGGSKIQRKEMIFAQSAGKQWSSTETKSLHYPITQSERSVFVPYRRPNVFAPQNAPANSPASCSYTGKMPSVKRGRIVKVRIISPKQSSRDPSWTGQTPADSQSNGSPQADEGKNRKQRKKISAAVINPSSSGDRYWTEEQTVALIEGVVAHGVGNWKSITKDPRFNRFLENRPVASFKVRGIPWICRNGGCLRKEGFRESFLLLWQDRWINLTKFGRKTEMKNSEKSRCSKSYYPSEEQMDVVRRCNELKRKKDEEKKKKKSKDPDKDSDLF